MIRRFQKFSLCVVSALYIFSDLAEAATGYPFVYPTADPVNSKIEEEWNFGILGGGMGARGQTRTNFLSTGAWERGWIARVPWIEFTFSYAPHPDFEILLQLPATIASSTLNLYYRINDYFKVGGKFGFLSTLSVTASVYPMSEWFISLTPSVTFNRFLFATKRTINSADFLSSPVYETIQESRFVVNGQLAVGRHIDPMDVALLVRYSYAPGNGINNSFIFDDTLMTHFLSVGFEAVF